MIVPDVNLLVHAHDSRSRRHGAARKWWEELMNGTGTVGLPWAAILGAKRPLSALGLAPAGEEAPPGG